MRLISSAELKLSEAYLKEAVIEAKKATCERAKCGSVIIKDAEVIGRGYNSPPNSLESQRRCSKKHELGKDFKSDRTCCVHAEQRAIYDALRKNPDKVEGSTLYFIRLNSEEKPEFAGAPYCTICSKAALDVGVAEFVLFHKEGLTAYDTAEYNDLSFAFGR